MADSIDLLTQLAIKHGTDKWGLHFYTPVYDELFREIRLKELKILEIGVGGYGYKNFGGESLRMWADYFPNSRIVGIDIEYKELKLPANVHYEHGSQVDTGFLDRVARKYGKFDIVVDDGSHRPDHVIASFQFLFPRMAERGFYVVEDTQTAFWPKWGGTENGAKLLGFIAAAIQSLHRSEIRLAKPDYEPAEFLKNVKSVKALHNLLIVEKGDNSAPSYFKFDPDHPAAKFALQTIEDRIAAEPTPAAYAQYAAVLSQSGRVEDALVAIEKGLQIWNDEPNLLLGGFEIAKARGQPQRALGFIARLKTESADPLVDHEMKKLRQTK